MPLPVARDDALDLHRPQADINVTPLVDVMLVLLIIFMVTAPMLAAGIKLNLPHASSATPVPPKPPLIVTVAKDGKILVGRNEAAPDNLAEAVRERLNGDLSGPVYVQGDKDALYGQVIAVIDRLTAAGVAKVVVLTDRKKGGAMEDWLSRPVGDLAHLRQP
ncbi:ExbD/TolR family protein [Rhodoblastus sp.]|uniref:ExbD/TolR family protein n=1 Tax=Rhodoblastus sp. TaxID=1962975 RepID=UPI003F9836DA